MQKVKEETVKEDRRSLLFLVYLVAMAAVLLVNAMAETVKGGNTQLSVMAVLAMAAAGASFLPFSSSNTRSITAADLLTFLVISVFGPLQGALIAGIEPLVSAHRSSVSYTSRLFRVVRPILAAYVAGHAFVQSRYLLSPQSHVEAIAVTEFAVPLIVLGLVFYLLSLSMTAIRTRLEQEIPILQTLTEDSTWNPAVFAAGAILMGTLSAAFGRFGVAPTAVGFMLVVPVPTLVYYTVKTYRGKLKDKQRHYEELAEINDSVVEMLVMAIDAKDQSAHARLHRLKNFTRRLGQIMGLSKAEIEALKAGALLHDIGKLGVPAYILNKKGRLAEHEFAQMKMHTVIGADMLSNIRFPFPVVPIVRHHHEQWDGKGYPDGLKGEEIPLTARILALVDRYDSLRYPQPDRPALTPEQAVGQVREKSGTVFDPRLVEVLAESIDQIELEAEVTLREQREASISGVKSADFGRSTALSAARPANGLEGEPPLDKAAAALVRVAEINQRVADLLDLSRTLAGSLTLDDAMAILTNRLSRLIPFTTCLISLFDPDSSEFEIVHAIGRDAMPALRRRLPISAGITGWVIQNQRPMYNTNPALDLGFIPPVAVGDYKSVLVFPLVKHSQALGAISLYSTDLQSYPSEYIQLMESISQPIADSIYHALAYQRVDRVLVADQSTGLANMRSLATQFEREMARSRRSGMPLSVMLASLEPNGSVPTLPDWEQTMSSMAELIRHRLRETDLIARQGSDTFLVLLPESGPAECDEVVGRIRRAISGQNPSSLSISFDHATSPVDGDSIEKLARSASRRRALGSTFPVDRRRFNPPSSLPAA